MAFWTDPKTDPLRKYQFFVRVGGDIKYEVKSVSLPSYEIEMEEYQMGNYRFKFPGIDSWTECSMTVVVPKTERLKKWQEFAAKGGGFTASQSPANVFGTKSKKGAAAKGFEICATDSEGKIQIKWLLQNAMVSSISYGELDYSSDELYSFDVTMVFDWCSITYG
jgi:hypothetical protein